MTCDLNEDFVKKTLNDDVILKEKTKEISNGLIQQKFDIFHFLENLGFALTSSNAEIRLQGIKLFSGTLAYLPPEYLSEMQLAPIANFFCDRLKDHHSVLPAVLDGIIVLEKMNVPKGFISKLFLNLFQHVPCQSQSREDRKKIFQIIEIATEIHFEELKTMGVDFVYGVMGCIDSERDPRNLDFLFTFMPKFLQKFPLYHLAEEMFEVFACYFPIDFQPVKNEGTVSRESLASKLADCLVASHDFVNWTLNLIFEKLDSDLKVAKLDSLELLTRCAKNFPPKLIESHFDKIWEALKVEIFPGSGDVEVLSAGLISLEEILKHISIDKEVSKCVQTTILGSILLHLSDAHHKLFKPANAIALICVRGDPLFASDKILNCLLLKVEVGDCDSEQLFEILTVIIDTLKICAKREVKEKINVDLQEKLQQILIKHLSNDIIDIDCMKMILCCILQIYDTLKYERRNIVYSFLKKTLIDEKNQINLKGFLKGICNHHSEELNQKCINCVLENFNSFSTLSKKRILSNISILINAEFFESTIINFFSGCIFEPSNTEIQEITLQSLRLFLEKEAKPEVIEKLYSTYKFLDKLISVTRQHPFPYLVLENICRILSLIVRSINKDNQKKVLDEYLPNFNLLNDLYLVNGIVGYIHKDVNLGHQFQRLLNDLTELSVSSDDETTRQICHHLLCTLLNKADNSEQNEKILKKLISKLEEKVKSSDEKAVEVLSWICKALIIRGYPEIEHIIAVIIELLDHPKLYHKAVFAFETISADSPGVHLPVVKALFRQKFFNITLKKLYNQLRVFSQPHINAFIYVLKATPQQILKMNIDKVAPILFKCLESGSLVSRRITLQVLKNFLNEKEEFFQPHINHLILHFLSLTSFKDSMEIRILALECLGSVAKYPTFLLLPYKVDVLLGLNSAIDDKKRLVRRVAVNVRNIWFLIGSINS